MSYSDSFPAQRASFMADFANAGRLDNRISFTRASSANVWDGSKHLSSENLIPYSNLSSGFSFARTTLASTNNSAPDGGSDAASILETADTGLHDVSESIGGCVSGTQYSFVFYLKANGRTKAVFKPQLTTVIAEVTFDLTAATSTVSSGSADSHSITAIGSTGWYKCAVTVTATGTGTGYTQFNLLDGSSSESYAGDVTKGMYAWGASVSSTGETVLNETSGQIHREYAPTLVSKANNVGRFDYSTDGQSAARGILVEGASTNLLTYSSDIANAAWTKTGTTATAEAIGPDGSLSAFAVREDTTTGWHKIAQAATVGSGSVCFSVYAKLLGNTRRLVLREDTTSGDAAVFDLSTGTVAAEVSGATGSIEAVGNGFYRCTMVCTPGAGSKSFGGWVVSSTATNYETGNTGDGFSGLLLAMPQIEDQSFASSWISTTSSTATRAAESLSVTDSSLFDNGGGALFVEASSIDKAAAYSGIASLNDGSSTNRVEVYNYYTYVRGDVSADGATQSSQYGGAFSPDVAYKACLTYASNNVSLYANGSEVGAADTAACMPTVDRITLGNTNSGTNYLNGHIKRVAVYSEALTDTNLQALTS